MGSENAPTSTPMTAEEWYFAAAAREYQDWAAGGGTWVTFPYRWFRELVEKRPAIRA